MEEIETKDKTSVIDLPAAIWLIFTADIFTLNRKFTFDKGGLIKYA